MVELQGVEIRNEVRARSVGPTLNPEDVVASCGPCRVAGCTLIMATVTHLGLHQVQGA